MTPFFFLKDKLKNVIVLKAILKCFEVV